MDNGFFVGFLLIINIAKLVMIAVGEIVLGLSISLEIWDSCFVAFQAEIAFSDYFGDLILGLQSLGVGSLKKFCRLVWLHGVCLVGNRSVLCKATPFIDKHSILSNGVKVFERFLIVFLGVGSMFSVCRVLV
ncbi:MAG: hypothetical protein ABI045_05345 [Flavobacteriales bacterium]